jgi:hypothetical protein
MKSATRKAIDKDQFLQRIDRAWGLHPGSGCLALVIDERYVRDDGIEYRYAVSYGEDLPDSNHGACFRGMAIATRRRLVTVVGHGNVEPAEPGLSVANARATARRILARIADAEYPRFVLDDARPTAPVRRSNADVIRRFEPESLGFFFGTRGASDW